jgi:hypothetical protein
MLLYVGNPEMGDQKRPTVIRNSIDVAYSHNLVDFMRELRFKLDFEYRLRRQGSHVSERQDEDHRFQDSSGKKFVKSITGFKFVIEV